MVNYKFEAYSIATIIILIGGLLRLYIYYKSFNVLILPFLDPAEIATIFFDNLLYFLAFTILNVFVLSIIYKNHADTSNNSEETSFRKRLKDYGVYRYNKAILFVILAILLYWINIQIDHIYFYEYFLWILLLLVSIYLNPILILESKLALKKNNIKVSHLSLLFLTGSLNLIIFSAFSGANEAYKAMSLNYYKGTEFEIGCDQKIISNDTTYYIGMTKQFVFFYDSKRKQTEVIPISKVNRMKY